MITQNDMCAISYSNPIMSEIDAITTVSSSFDSNLVLDDSAVTNTIIWDSTKMESAQDYSLKGIIYGKEGNVILDMTNMKFKVYSETDGWVEYELDDIRTEIKDGRKITLLSGSRPTTVLEIIGERKNRKVLVEKKKNIYNKTNATTTTPYIITTIPHVITTTPHTITVMPHIITTTPCTVTATPYVNGDIKFNDNTEFNSDTKIRYYNDTNVVGNPIVNNDIKDGNYLPFQGTINYANTAIA